MKSTIDSIQGKNILIVCFTGMTPHLETSLEICRRLSEKNDVSYIHLGNYVSRPTLYPSEIIKRNSQLRVRIRRAENYIRRHSKENKKIKLLQPKQYNQKLKLLMNSYADALQNNDIGSIKELKELKFKNYNIGIGIASTLISDAKDPDPFPLTIKNKNEIQELLNSSLISLAFAKILLDESHNYNGLVILNGRFHCENAIKQIAYEKKVEVFFHERSFQCKRFFFENYMPHDFTKRKEEMAKMNCHIKADVISSIGKHFFDKKTKGDGVYEESHVRNQLNVLTENLQIKIKECRKNNIKIVSYFTANDDEYKFIDGSSARYPLWGSQGEAIKSISKIARSMNFYLIVRVHPNLKRKNKQEQDRWNKIGESIKNEGFYWVSQVEKDSTYSLISQSDLIITAGSTVGIEAISMRKPSIVINSCKYDGIINSVKLCDSPTRLKEVLGDKSTYKQPNPSDSYIFGAWIMIYGPEFEFFIPDGNQYGVMKDGSRIASAGILQRTISKIKNRFNNN